MDFGIHTVCMWQWILSLFLQSLIIFEVLLSLLPFYAIFICCFILLKWKIYKYSLQNICDPLWENQPLIKEIED